MRILEIILFEYILGYILQGFAFSLGIFAFSARKLEISKGIISGVVITLIFYITRLLPFSFGIHTMINFLCMSVFAIFFLKIPAFAAIRSIIILLILVIMTELISVLLMTGILGQAVINNMMNDSLDKAIIALPSSILFAVFCVIAYIVSIKIKKKKSVRNGGSGT